MNDHVLPTIPVLPLSYSDAYQVLSNIGGFSAPFDWQGGLNLTYCLGPVMKDNNEIQITVHSSLETRYWDRDIEFIQFTDFNKLILSFLINSQLFNFEYFVEII